MDDYYFQQQEEEIEQEEDDLESQPNVYDIVDGCRYLVFAGGAIRGVAMCAAYYTLSSIYRDRNGGVELRDVIKGAGGTSIGASIALAIVCGIEDEMVKQMVYNDDILEIESLVKSADPISFWNEGGFLKHSILFKKIDYLFSILGLDVNIDFKGLYEKTGKEFICNACTIEDTSVTYFSRTTTPYLKVRDALCMTMCLPIFFVGYRYQNREYHDGGLYANYIIDQFPVGETIGFIVDDRAGIATHLHSSSSSATASSSGGGSENKNTISDSNSDFNGLKKLTALIKSLCTRITINTLENLDPIHFSSTIFLYTPGFGPVTIHVDKDEIDKLWIYGILSMWWFLDKNTLIQLLLGLYVNKLMIQQSDIPPMYHPPSDPPQQQQLQHHGEPLINYIYYSDFNFIDDSDHIDIQIEYEPTFIHEESEGEEEEEVSSDG